ncbi:Rab-3-interacting molecule unc-10, partial [Brachionus plicatilis]
MISILENVSKLTISNSSANVRSNTNQNFSTLTSSNNSLSHVDQIKLKKSQRHSISDIAQETKQRYGSVDTGNVCDICKKIKFTNSSVGRVCFSCKSRCCIRCSVKYITKTKEIWMCSDCKKKQDELLQTTFLKRKKNPTEVMPANETGHVNPTSSKRQLPNLSRIKQLSQDESSSLAHEQSPLNTTNSLARKPGRLKMVLVKQASLTNPPNYFKEPTEPNFLPNSTSNKHASTQELNKHLSSDNFYSSPGSSISMISRSKAERIADPTLLYKVSRSSSQKNSSSNLSQLAQVDIDESSMYQREKSLNALLKEKEMQQQEVPIKATQLQHGTSLAHKTLEEIQSKLEELNVSGENSSLDRPTKVRKQPVLPALPVDTSTIKHRLLAELKQRSIN